jgi:UDPglucose 6-dehydrogenase
MKISVFGSGYVGLVTGTCLADAGNEVLCMDVDVERVARLRAGEVPIHEPGLDELLSVNRRAGRIRFTTDVAEAVGHGAVQFIAVGTPPDEDGSADLQYVLAVARSIAEHMDGYRVIADKSTVPVGTAWRVRETIAEGLRQRGLQHPFSVVSNPEFLKEGAAIADFMKPDRIVIGSDDHRATALMRELYRPFSRNHDKLIVMDIPSAELTKYAANALLATKISFMNELANLAERLGADIEAVRNGIGSDPRIGYQFIYPGCGYGGSCFPKDVKALAHTARQVGYEPRILDAVDAVNRDQKTVLFERLRGHYGESLAGRCIALWGLAFKPSTDDMREAPSRDLMEALWAAGARVQAYDPEAMAETARIYPDHPELTLCDSPYAALEGADALAVCTEWQVFRSPDFDRIASSLRDPLIVDGRNLYDPEMLAARGFTYYGIGRGASLRRQV